MKVIRKIIIFESRDEFVFNSAEIEASNYELTYMMEDFRTGEIHAEYTLKSSRK